MSIYDHNDIGLTAENHARGRAEAARRGLDPDAPIEPVPAGPDEHGPEPHFHAPPELSPGAPPPGPARRRLTRDQLMTMIPKAVAAMPGGGCSRAELAAELRVDHGQLGPALAGCYRRKEIDFVQGYVVAPPRVRSVR